LNVQPNRPLRTTAAISAITAIAFLLQDFAGPHVILQAGFIPVRLTAAYPFTAVPFALTPLTATLLHGGWAHLGFNLLMLIYCGRQVESVLGGLRLLILYVLGAYGAALGQYLYDPGASAPMIGASGAISAVIGTYALMFGRNQVKRIGPVPALAVRALWLAAAWLVLQWGVGFISGGTGTPIAVAAHVGGFLTGLVLMYPLLEWRYRYG
jgi:membrane associated rhomboid family serine protease